MATEPKSSKTATPATTLDVPTDPKPNAVETLFAELDAAYLQAEARLIAARSELKIAEEQFSQLELIKSIRDGKFTLPAPASADTAKPARKPRSSSGPRAPRGEIQQQILSVLADKPDGLSRGEFIETLNIKADAKAQGRLTAALGNMKRSGKLGQRDGKYVAA